MRVILYTGKGGVGKTSVAAATACRLAEEGKRVIVMSTDAAHSLGDSFEKKLGCEPGPVMESLDAMEIDVVREGEAAWGHLQGYIKQVLTSRANNGMEVEELLVFPGLEELFSLFKILDICEMGIYDVVIVDCAPTGETMSLLKFPELFGGLLKKLLPVKRKVVRAVGPAVEKLTKIPMPEDGVFSDIERLMDKLERLRNLMMDKDKVSIRIVTTPERIVIQEAKRNFTYLHLYDYNVDAVIVNKVYPEEALDGYFNKWMELQKEGLKEIRECFRDIPQFYLMLKKRELKSIPILSEAASLYGDKDPSDVWFRDRIFEIHTEGESPEMDIYLPFADRGEMEMEQQGGELHITIRNEGRCFLLPDSLKGLEVASARLESGVLKIIFQTRNNFLT